MVWASWSTVRLFSTAIVIGRISSLAFGANVGAAELEAMVEGFWSSQRGLAVGRARGRDAHLAATEPAGRS